MTERSTSEVAALFGLPTYTIRKWKARGLLPNAPQGVSGQGRGVECRWSEDAVAEVGRVVEAKRLLSGGRKRKVAP